MTDAAPPAAILPPPREIDGGDLRAVLRAGWTDFRRAPLFGLAFAGFYVAAGLVLVAAGAGLLAWTLTLSLGFPLVAPFAAVGLYEVSRQLERGEPLRWGEVLGVVLAERGRQMPWIGGVILVTFLFWSFLAHLLFALFFGAQAIVDIHADPLSLLLTPRGLALAAVELALGGAVAWALYTWTVISLPLLLDREVDFITAMIASRRAVVRNRRAMAAWACVIAILTVSAMVPAFLGLLVVLPVLGHASWHLYRRLLPGGDQAAARAATS